MSLANCGSEVTKIGTPSVHVGSLSEVSRDTTNYNCTLLSIVTMLNTLYDRYLAGMLKSTLLLNRCMLV